MAVLVEIRGDQQREYRLAGRVTIGRAASSTIVVDDPLVSRHHAEVERTEDGDYQLVDLGSTHGTFVQKEKISDYILQDGDEVIIGATRLRFHHSFESVSRRRWDERVACDLSVDITLANGEVTEARATDISLGGMRLVGDNLPQLDEVVSLSVAFPKKLRRSKIDARVVYASSESGSAGVAFMFSSDRARRKLAEEFAQILRTNKKLR